MNHREFHVSDLSLIPRNYISIDHYIIDYIILSSSTINQIEGIESAPIDSLQTGNTGQTRVLGRYGLPPERGTARSGLIVAALEFNVENSFDLQYLYGRKDAAVPRVLKKPNRAIVTRAQSLLDQDFLNGRRTN